MIAPKQTDVWRTMESAPRDGTQILWRSKDACCVIQWPEYRECFEHGLWTHVPPVNFSCSKCGAALHSDKPAEGDQCLDCILEPTPLEAARKLLVAAAVGSCTCNTKSPELLWHAPNCRYVQIMMALENVEIAAGRSAHIHDERQASSPLPSKDNGTAKRDSPDEHPQAPLPGGR